MESSDQLMQELETHVQRILEYYDPKQPYARFLNVSEKRGDLINALSRYIDERIEDRIAQFAQDLTAAARTRTTARSDWPHPK
jgi:outer membrane translocation and assembly module TamA